MKPLDAKQISDGVKSLSDSLSNTVPGIILKTIKGDIRELETALKRSDFAKARSVVGGLSFVNGVENTEKANRKFTRSTALVGAGAVDNPKQSIFAKGAPFPWEVDQAAVRLLQSMMNRQLTRDVRKRLMARVDAASAFVSPVPVEKAATIDPDKLAKDINRYLRGEIRRVVDISSNIVGTRVAAHGMFYEARARGVSRYRIDAVVDSVTTDICRAMDGRIFDVERAFERSGQVLSATTADQQKKAAPFPPNVKQEIDALMQNSSEDLQSLGFDTPPFHFLCRSVVTLIDTVIEYDPVDWSNFPDAGKQAINHEKDIMPKLDRLARKTFGFDDLDELFTTALKEYDVEAELYAPNAYSGSVFSIMNRNLRANEALSPDNQIIAANLDKLIEKSPAPDVIYSYRGVTGKVAEEFKVGKTFQDDSYMSVSVSPEVAESFSGVSQNILQIQIGTGTKVMPLYAASTVPAEGELLLARGTQLRIIGSAEQTLANGERVTIWRAVVQGTGDRQAIKDVGQTDLPNVVSVVKAETRLEEKFLYENGQLRETT